MRRFIHYSNAGIVRLLGADIASVPQQGAADEAIAALAQVPRIAAQLDRIGHAAMASELSEYGAWTPEELADETTTRERFLWCAVCDVRENPAQYAA